MSEFELCNEVDANPSEYKMRQNFADAVKVARDTGKKIRVSSIYEDVIGRQNFFNYVVPNPIKMAFIMRPVVTHMQYYDAIHKEGLRKIWYYIKNYDLDPKTMATFAKIIEKAGDRTVGPVAQRIQMHQKQEVTHTAVTPGRDVSPDDPVALQAKVDEMQAKLREMHAKKLEAPKDIDVEFE